MTQDHLPSHRRLLAPPSAIGVSGNARGFDAVVVPSARDVRHLSHAAGVARRADAHLVVICSRDASPESVHAAVAPHRGGLQATVVALPHDYVHEDLVFETSALTMATKRRDCDTWTKRNVGLLLARMMGWQHLLFLDDDVRGIGDHHLTLMSEAVTGSPSGWRAAGCAFPEYGQGRTGGARTADNSLVCHAHRLTGGAQDTFIGGGALAVRMTDAWPFFPNVYNEDWLFLLGLIWWQRKSVALAGELRQLPQDPFPSRAVAEQQEFGDVLGEGLARVLQLKLPPSTVTTLGYWNDVLAMRHRFVHSIYGTLNRRDDDDARRAVASLEGARDVLDEIGADHLVEYVTCWHRDLRSWTRRQARLPRETTMVEAIAYLGLTGYTIPAPRALMAGAVRSLGGRVNPASWATRTRSRSGKRAVTARTRSTTATWPPTSS